ncbi:PucR family transcriptional regulator [Nocardiopsis ansamitocini]|uniref:PucR family transcriptional regulator n=1 Tax=Nocardiopsis ansamitocini TaxID=1670832 RepID=A0A9W6P882_9ACTN|nr:PucR family transcriptional regulator [Nocardiopsis ansamitocini]GLU48852.1 hypothetical protein Nans01_32030 [Nocardiopsis ansamitocini]
MTLTVRGLVAHDDLEVRAVAGTSGLDNPIRWAHVTELADPVRWLRGGELVLTVGLGLGATPAEQRAYVARLSAAGCAGLGVAVDTWLSELPPAVPEAAGACELPLLVVEGSTPFIAIVEAVADHYAAERVEAQRQVLAAQDAMARAALRSGPAGVLGELATATGGQALLLDRNGMTASTAPAGEPAWHAAARSALVLDGSRPRGMTVLADGAASVLLQSLGASGTTLGWLGLRCASPVSTHTRMLANHAASLLAVDLLHSRDARRALHHQRAPLLRALIEGSTATEELTTRLLPLPVGPLEVAYYPGDDPARLLDAAADALPDVLGDTTGTERVAMCALGAGLVVVLPDTSGTGPRVGERLLGVLSAAAGAERSAGACGARGPSGIREAVARARHAATTGRGYRNTDDADSWSVLRGAIDPAAEREFTRSVLGALQEHDTRNGADLVHTLRHYLDNGAGIEATARDLGVHRNTLRTRLRTAERVMGRSLDSPRHRLELALAMELSPDPDHTGEDLE